MACPELIRNAGLRDRFNTERFNVLHPDGRRLIAHWFTLAHDRLNCDAVDSFEPFIHAWIALNGWASCCTDLDQDRQLVEALSGNPELVQRFDQFVLESAVFRANVERFRSLWPVFKVQELRRRRIPMYLDLDRQGMVAHYFDRGAKGFAPACFQRHAAIGEQIPMDWPHVLAVIYQVRCNLFHGDKAPHSEIDRILVHSALQILVRFLSRWGYMP